MKTILFGDHLSPHVHRWSKYLEDAQVEVITVGYGETEANDRYAYTRLVDRSARIATKLGKFASFIADLALIRRERPDFISVHFLTLRYAILILLAGVPAVLTCWGSDILVDLPASRGIARAVRRAALRRARRITCDSADVARVIDGEVPGAGGKTRIVFWGIDTARFDFAEPGNDAGAEARRRLGIPADATVLLSNRLAAPNYRIRDIVEQFAARVAEPSTHFIVRIQSGAPAAYADECRKASLGDPRIHWHEGPLPDSGMADLYHASDAVLHFPISDATPVSMLEALACGCAVIASDERESYRALEADYRILRIPLQDLDDAAVRDALDLRNQHARANAAAIGRIHSRAATVETLRRIAEDLSGVEGENP